MTRTHVGLALAAAVVAAACQGRDGQPDETKAPAATATLATEEEKTVYAIGLIMGGQLTSLGLSENELEALRQGLVAAATGQKPAVDLETYGPKVQAFAEGRVQAAGSAFAETAAREPGAVKTGSGLVFKTLDAGSGRSPGAADVVRVHYQGTFTDGTPFDSSVERGEPVEFALNEVIPCWTEGLQRMKLGEKARLVCPAGIAYGEQGRPPKIPGGATLVFEVELLDARPR
jgi:FKBP-type peptidyl-prolyl cis-trans isomerase FkpA